MPAVLGQPVLTLATDAVQQLRAIDESDLSTFWGVITKCKDNLEKGHRLENLSWRLWYCSVHQKGRKENDLAQAVASLPEYFPPRKTPTASPQSLPCRGDSLAITSLELPSSSRSQPETAPQPRPHLQVHAHDRPPPQSQLQPQPQLLPQLDTAPAHTSEPARMIIDVRPEVLPLPRMPHSADSNTTVVEPFAPPAQPQAHQQTLAPSVRVASPPAAAPAPGGASDGKVKFFFSETNSERSDEGEPSDHLVAGPATAAAARATLLSAPPAAPRIRPTVFSPPPKPKPAASASRPPVLAHRPAGPSAALQDEAGPESDYSTDTYADDDDDDYDDDDDFDDDYDDYDDEDDPLASGSGSIMFEKVDITDSPQQSPEKRRSLLSDALLRTSAGTSLKRIRTHSRLNVASHDHTGDPAPVQDNLHADPHLTELTESLRQNLMHERRQPFLMSRNPSAASEQQNYEDPEYW
ncbi:uncharacterized protein BJ171DRAFT_89946 [Polychytrium aggregatum]|uniref:uncharacterized protein n=1 Tax=Polychytrium aggregatum TaxID=110093 RepID=UPI0022FE962C|nr:uncharacterized protein BJ171DRAFT_89946 [Polychytrium aggregatum]KAI9204810.1 hypothetical protein BJ171DRAFT_89946 [Polychytrium aggregatum]